MLNEDINNAGQQVQDRILDSKSWTALGIADNMQTHAVRQQLPCLRLISLPNESMQLTVDELKQNAIYCQNIQWERSARSVQKTFMLRRGRGGIFKRNI